MAARDGQAGIQQGTGHLGQRRAIPAAQVDPRGEQIVNAVFSPQGEHLIATRRLGDGFSGTGDILASVLCGGLARKMKPQAALDLAAALLQKAIAHTFAEGTDPNDGVAFEPYLYLLTDREAYQ